MLNRIVLIIVVFLVASGIVRQETSYAEKITSGRILRVMQDYVKANTSRRTKTFDVYDPVKKVNRRLEFRKFNRKVGKIKEDYYSSAIFRDLGNSEWVNLEFDIGKMKDGSLKVKRVNIYMVGGKRRYIYDNKGNRIPLRR